MAGEGFEPTTTSGFPAEKSNGSLHGDAESDAVDSELADVSRTWRTLPTHIRATILTLIEASRNLHVNSE